MSNFVEIDNQKLHFYTMGKGPALLMLHPSPSSSLSLIPLARQLALHYTVYCVDTPGYGQSDALIESPTHLSNYTAFLYKALKKMGLKKPAIYGSATGAQLAVRYGLEYPEVVSHIFLDNSAHFDDALSDKILEHYFPDLTPKLDGGHLTQIWTIVSQLFQYFPWCFTTEEYALNRPQMPDFVLQMIAMDYLRAGSTYDIAYKLAFQHERGQYVQQLKVPTTIFRWNNSIITKYVDQLLAHDFEDHIQGFMIEGDATERTEKMVAFMNEKATEFGVETIDTSEINVQEEIQLVYKKSTSTPPEVQSNGNHLLVAWQDLVENNPQETAETIQTYLTDWYSENFEVDKK
ncbi:alpha/beta hydrolase [Maribacter algarum]|uniref:Alpha/beta hydrolase n=1 Tax=Maribacter algarum (ex Zhang et al. 2020) TaxID=2578118 RepID=A0A5S3PUH6_9FLAO|nr:alpha/beta hydrolase [Maribacter algarum]TMM58659.1 alpha/beta hydrolase [Maribacter algarum]